MRIHFLGTCSGTEPMAGMHHCSFVLEIGCALYWFDAGESCSYTAYTSGIDIMKTEALFVSHPHIDHIGGLANLLFCMDKLNSRYGKRLPNDNSLEVFFPDPAVFAAIKTVAAGNTDMRLRFDINEHGLTDGVVFEDERLRVTALHNGHMKDSDGTDVFRSFSFLLEAEGKRIVYSGDVKAISELDALLYGGADVLIMETGHHRVTDVCEYASANRVKKLRLNHHGREIIEDRQSAEQWISEYTEGHDTSILLCYDGMVEDL